MPDPHFVVNKNAATTLMIIALRKAVDSAENDGQKLAALHTFLTHWNEVNQWGQ
jgi:hypothetical protein